MPKQFATSLSDIQDAAVRHLLGNRAHSNGGLAIGTTKTKVTTANALDYSIAGIMYSKAGTVDLFAHSDTTVQAAGTTKYYALCLDASGTASIVAGPVTANVDGTTYSVAVGMPPVPSTLCCVGILKVATDATHTFTPGTTNHDATGVTTTYTNISVIPYTLP